MAFGFCKGILWSNMRLNFLLFSFYTNILQHHCNGNWDTFSPNLPVASHATEEKAKPFQICFSAEPCPVNPCLLFLTSFAITPLLPLYINYPGFLDGTTAGPVSMALPVMVFVIYLSPYCLCVSVQVLFLRDTSSYHSLKPSCSSPRTYWV